MTANDKLTKKPLTSNELLAAIDDLRQQQGLLQRRLDAEQEQLQQLAKRLWLQQEHERARLARDLHDDLGQQLTGIATQLAQFTDDERLSAIYQHVKTAIESTRTLSRLLHPTLVQDLGLKAGIQWLGRQLLAPAGVSLKLDFTLNGELESDVELFFFRILQAAMVNTVRYAKASQFDVFLSQSEGGLFLLLRDDGQGFDSKTTTYGVGLQSIHDRTQAFDAMFKLITAPGKGCEMQIHLPYQKSGTEVAR
ncbi:MAG: two-component sensor histidine kinase [Idiomarinaceae bacterium]|uniref:histidine kinase n=1 Tax=Pseudidiomarina aquimaris TaxID=641841 RepID=A0A432XB44_9GAMM|nr:sensor histidine kinase [Pseudidiomarina aquimaris]MBG22059.1 two-component sensor histidine kinase [Idiomarinaceae bacterium]RUO45971.1 two-component sensor histidine kinase [Pseudidiomarina aquimaris]|tara:strand:- start:358 stop:1110 length:753 start_codon:yes stop_codon:yes gene_type:complete